jgi:hypothetical protein
MTKSEVRARIEDIGIIPGVRVAVTDHARFAARSRCTVPVSPSRKLP